MSPLSMQSENNDLEAVGLEVTLGDETEQEKLLRAIASQGKTGYSQILLYNSIRDNGTAKDGIQAFSDIHANLMGLHGFMAGFQFLVLDGGESTDFGRLGTVTFMLRVFGFLFSLLGTLISLITMEFLKSVEQENMDLQVEGILKYSGFFRHSDELAFLAAFCLVLSTNLLLHSYVVLWLAIAVNALCGLSFLYFLVMFKVMIIDRQSFGNGRKLYMNEHFKKSLKSN